MSQLYIATFKSATGRYLVEDLAQTWAEAGRAYGGQRIADARQEKYGNHPDPVSGLYLYESYRTFSASDLKSIRRHP